MINLAWSCTADGWRYISAVDGATEISPCILDIILLLRD